MKIYYDKQVDALYLQLTELEPDGVIELSEGINLDTASDGKILGIEILEASQKLNLETILNYSIDAEALKNLI